MTVGWNPSSYLHGLPGAMPFYWEGVMVVPCMSCHNIPFLLFAACLAPLLSPHGWGSMFLILVGSESFALLWNTISAELISLLLTGVVHSYRSANWTSSLASMAFFMTPFSDPTCHPMNQLDLGYHGEDVISLISHSVEMFENGWPLLGGPLSDQMIFGTHSPIIAQCFLRIYVTVSDVARAGSLSTRGNLV